MTKRVRVRNKTESVVIADGETTSGAIETNGMMAAYVLVPAGFNGTSLKPQISLDGTNFYDVYESDDTDGSAVTLTVAAERMYTLSVENWFAPYLRFVADAQTGAATIMVVLS